MLTIVTRNTFVHGQPYEASPDPAEIADGVAKELIGMGKAVIYAPPALVVQAVPQNPDDDISETTAALERFGRVLETARKKPGSAQAKAFADLKIDLASSTLPAQIMSNSIDALAVVEDLAERDVLKVALFGKEADFVDALIEQALGAA